MPLPNGFPWLTTRPPQKTIPAQGPPPKNLTVRPDGHVSANQDPANPDQFEVHVVKQGETLSGISGEVRFDDILDGRGQSFKYARIPDDHAARRNGATTVGEALQQALDVKPCKT